MGRTSWPRNPLLFVIGGVLLPFVFYCLGYQSCQVAETDSVEGLQSLVNSLIEEKKEMETNLEASKAKMNADIQLMLRAAEAGRAVGELNADTCRDVFGPLGKGGMGELSQESVNMHCGNAAGACQDLQDFTGLSNDEFSKRMRRKGRFHFEGEHAFWNPQSKTELAWYYTTSIDYLFANVLHSVENFAANYVSKKEFEPVLEYSGGTGNNVIEIAKRGIRTHYFGVGMAEYHFAQYRVLRHGVEDMVEFKRPYSAKTGWKFDPITDPLPQDGSLGSILAIDVLEHIPDYHLVVEAMVKSIRVGGVIIERSPFNEESVEGDGVDLRVHLHFKKTMEEAMGPNMKLVFGNGSLNIWKRET